MPLTGPNSYLSTMDEFSAHWSQVNEVLDGEVGELKLQGGYTLSDFDADRAALREAADTLSNAVTLRQLAAAQRDELKEPLRARLAQFRAAVQGFLQGSPYQHALPVLPHQMAVESRYLNPLEDAAHLWERINADTTLDGFTPPFVLMGGYTREDFLIDIAALRAAFLAVHNALGSERLARERRDTLLPPIRQRLNQYRAAVRASFPTGAAMVQSLPVLTPSPGATPDPVALTGVWDDTTAQAVLTWTASENPNLDHYSLRTAPGPRYRAADETVLTSIPAQTLTIATTAGLSAPHSSAVFKVYVVLTTGNEKGSNAVTVTRPA